MLEEGVIIEHIPRELSRLCHHFIRRRGTIQVQVIDCQISRSYRLPDIPAGGLEITALYIFYFPRFKLYRQYYKCNQVGIIYVYKKLYASI